MHFCNKGFLRAFSPQRSEYLGGPRHRSLDAVVSAKFFGDVFNTFKGAANAVADAGTWDSDEPWLFECYCRIWKCGDNSRLSGWEVRKNVRVEARMSFAKRKVAQI